MILEQSGPLAPANEPWTLIRDAIKDLELQEKQEGVKIEMNSWHDPYGGGACHQCLAGSVMARRLGVDTGAVAFPDNFPDDVRDRLRALEELRCGAIGDAYVYLGLEHPDTLPRDTCIPSYRDDPDDFKESMLALADQLEAAQPTKTNQ